MLELVHSSRPHVEYTSTKNGWGAVVRAFVDGGKRVEAEGFGDAKGDAEDAAYGAVSDALRDVVGDARHADRPRGSRSVPGGSVATLRIPPLPDDAMDVLINAMGTPEDHDARMRAWKTAEARAMASTSVAEEDVSALESGDGGYRRRKNTPRTPRDDARRGYGGRRRGDARGDRGVVRGGGGARAAAAGRDPSGPEAAMRATRAAPTDIGGYAVDLCDALSAHPWWWCPAARGRESPRSARNTSWRMRYGAGRARRRASW